MRDRIIDLFEKHSIQTNLIGGLMDFELFEAAVNELIEPYKELIQEYQNHVLLIGEENISKGTFKLIWEGKDYSND